MRSMDEKKPDIEDVNHFCVFKSPNSMPRAIRKNIETITNKKHSQRFRLEKTEAIGFKQM